MPVMPVDLAGCGSSSNGSMSDNSDTSDDPQKGLDKCDDICRDYLRNVCKRGKRCKYRHPDGGEAKELGRRQEYTFCHDFQNSGCRRPSCRFIHCTRDEEKYFKQTGTLPVHVQQATVLGVGVVQNKVPLLRGEVPVCKDYLKGQCMRGNRCKYRHITRSQYDVELTRKEGSSSSTVASEDSATTPGATTIDVYPAPTYYPEANTCTYQAETAAAAATAYTPAIKRRRLEEAFPAAAIISSTLNHTVAVTNNHGTHNGYYRATPTPADYTWLLEEENAILRRKIEELKKQVSDLAATNEVLLETNARYRATKTATVTVPPIVTVSQVVTPTISSALAVARPMLQAHAGQPSITAANISSIPQITVNGNSELVVSQTPAPTIQILNPTQAVSMAMNPPPPPDGQIVNMSVAMDVPPPGTLSATVTLPQKLTTAVCIHQDVTGPTPGLICSVPTTALVSYPIMSHTPIMSLTPLPNSSLG